MSYTEETTKERFLAMAVQLEKHQAVPMVVIGCILSEINKGAIVVLNAQGKTDIEVLNILKEVVKQMEHQFQ